MKRARVVGTRWALAALAVAVSVALLSGRETARAPAAVATGLPSEFGVHGAIPAGSDDPDVTPLLLELGAGWVRLNYDMDGDLPDFARFLNAGVDVIVTFKNRDPQNVADPAALLTYPRAGFPFVDETVYRNRILEALTPLLSYLSSGRQLYAQFENEVGLFNAYWQGDLNAYLTQLNAAYEAVHSLSPDIPVVTYGIASGFTEVIVSDPEQAEDAIQWLTALFTNGRYDAIDLHFYHCAETIPAKVQAVLSLLPAPKPWISTENGGPDTRCPSTPVFTEELQAEQVPERLQACAENGGRICLWFSFFDLINEPPPFDTLGLLERPADPGGEPRKKPAYWAFQAYVAEGGGKATPTPAPVGGVAELPDVLQPQASQADSPADGLLGVYGAVAGGIAAAAAVIAAGAWYARRCRT